MICVSYTRNRIKFGEAISITEQNEKIAAFVKGRRMTIDKKYSDRKEDVNADEGYLEMKEAGINRQFDCVIFWSMMYFGNDPLVGYNLLLHTFIPAGIDFAVVCDNFFSVGHSSEEIEEYLFSKYKERRRAHGKNILKSAADKRRNTLYGYVKHGDEFEIDTNVEQIVKKIFDMALKEHTISEICKFLNDKYIDCPQVYLRKIADYGIDNVKNNWCREHVKKILTDTRYKGIRTISKNGVITEKQMVSYISENQFNKIQNLFKRFDSRNRSVNLFSKMIYDNDSHIKLYMGDYMSDGGNYYYLSRKTPEYEQYKKKVIEVEDVIIDVSEQLKRESELAKHIITCLKSKSGQAEIFRRKDELLVEIQEKLDDLLNEVNNKVTADTYLLNDEKIDRLDKELSQLISKKEDFELAFSDANPWCKLYSYMQDFDEISFDFSKKYVGEILVEQFEKVILVPKCNEWKSLLPSYWLEV